MDIAIGYVIVSLQIIDVVTQLALYAKIDGRDVWNVLPKVGSGKWKVESRQPTLRREPLAEMGLVVTGVKLNPGRKFAEMLMTQRSFSFEVKTTETFWCEKKSEEVQSLWVRCGGTTKQQFRDFKAWLVEIGALKYDNPNVSRPTTSPDDWEQIRRVRVGELTWDGFK